ncbi:hypothetical protein JZU48_01685, partial [bacterium]|nr:hypothetical protein [bacterium]
MSGIGTPFDDCPAFHRQLNMGAAASNFNGDTIKMRFIFIELMGKYTYIQQFISLVYFDFGFYLLIFIRIFEFGLIGRAAKPS